jgi:hypothetical protein
MVVDFDVFVFINTPLPAKISLRKCSMTQMETGYKRRGLFATFNHAYDKKCHFVSGILVNISKAAQNESL